MFARIRTVALGILGVAVALSGLSYAGSGTPNPLNAVVTTVSDVVPEPTPTATPAPTEAPKAPASRNRGKEKRPRSAEGCPEGFTGNHGQYVSGTDERPRRDAARSDCGKR